MKHVAVTENYDEPVRCPRCKSSQIHAGRLGWNLATGLLGSGQIVLTCMKCGHRFWPGKIGTYRKWIFWITFLIIFGTLMIISH